jgi:Virulence factor
MAQLIIISWRDIPAQVVCKRGRETAKIQLSARFQEAVDRAAMRAGKGSSDAYLADWKRSEPQPCGDDIHAVVAVKAAQIEARFTDEDLERLIKAKGLQPPSADVAVDSGGSTAPADPEGPAGPAGSPGA